MNNDRELQDLWCGTTKGETPMRAEEMVLIVKRRTAEFDRVIHRRNLREVIAGLVGAIFFAWGAYRSDATLARIGNIVVSLSMLWVIGYLLRYGSEPELPDANADAETYRRALIARYDQQIKLLRRVKYWYLLPPYVGLVLLLSSNWGWMALFTISLVTVVYGVVWYLNEVYAVRRLKAARNQLLQTL